MALIHCNFFSSTLGMASSMDVILPQRGEGPARQPGESPPCLLLLHGLSDDHTIWQRRTSIERYAAPLGLAVVMPNVHRSFYTDMRRGYPYWTYLAEEVPAVLQDLFHLAPPQERSFVAGLSMGGYGAFKLALRCPDRFAAAASLSGALDVAARLPDAQSAPDRVRDWELLYGDNAGPAPEDDLFALATRAAQNAVPLPRLYAWCGTEDFLFDHNQRFRDRLATLGIPLTYEQSPGDHDWGCWDRMIQRVLTWMLTPPAA